MRKIRLGGTGVNLAPVALGTWSYGGPNFNGDLAVGWTGHDDQRARAALRRAYEQDIRHWDTADAYGDGRAEALIGSVWGDIPREDVFLASKVGWVQGPYEHYYHPDQIRSAMENTLRFLRTECVDLYYLHHCNFGDEDELLDDALELVYRFRDEGKTRFVGLSDWKSEQVAAFADRVQPDVVQVYRNAMDDTYVSSGLKAWVDAADAGVVFFSPLKQGLLLGKYETPATFGAGDVRGRTPEFEDQQLIGHLRQAAEAVRERVEGYDDPVLHVLLESILVDAPSACTLVGLRNVDQVNAAREAIGRMTTADMKWVRDLYRRP